MNRIFSLSLALMVALVLSLHTSGASAADAAKDKAKDTTKTVSGKISCGGCDGVAKGCCVMLTDKDGGRWVLRGDAAKKVFDDRHNGKSYKASYSEEPTTKKGSDGKDYKEVKASEVKAG